MKRQDEERTDLVILKNYFFYIHSFSLFLFLFIFLSKAKSRIWALWLLVQTLIGRTAPNGGAEAAILVVELILIDKVGRNGVGSI